MPLDSAAFILLTLFNSCPGPCLGTALLISGTRTASHFARQLPPPSRLLVSKAVECRHCIWNWNWDWNTAPARESSFAPRSFIHRLAVVVWSLFKSPTQGPRIWSGHAPQHSKAKSAQTHLFFPFTSASFHFFFLPRFASYGIYLILPPKGELVIATADEEFCCGLLSKTDSQRILHAGPPKPDSSFLIPHVSEPSS